MHHRGQQLDQHQLGRFVAGSCRDDILRLASSIKHGTVTASLMLRKLGSYPSQNGLSIALRELGRIERTLFILDIMSPQPQMLCCVPGCRKN